MKKMPTMCQHPEREASCCTNQARQPARRRLGRRVNMVAVAALVLFVIQVLVCSSVKADTNVLAFSRTRYNASIYENSLAKSYVTPEGRMGIQNSDNDLQIRYRIISGDKDKFFKAEARQVGDFCFLFLRTRSGQINVLNRERADLYKLKIRAFIVRGSHGKEEDVDVETEVWVYVLDTNDLSPLFYPSEYKIDVPEDTPLHQSIMAVKADDADVGINGEIYFSLAEPTEQFAVHPLTGVITLTRPLVFAEKSFHELVVLAVDRGPQLRTVAETSRAKVLIYVTRVNQHDPQIHVHHLPEVMEQSNVDVYAIVRVEDQDEGPSGQVDTLDIIDGDSDGYFRIQKGSKKNEFSIAVLRLLDREQAPQGYNLTLRAIDRGTPRRNSTKLVHVTVADLNDHAPIFEKEHYEVNIPESAPVGTPLLRLKVTDLDQGRNAQVHLNIVGGNEGGIFRINSLSGVLYTALPLDAETRSEYVLTVSAIDQGTAGMRKQSSAKVTVNVLDTNDNDPVFLYGNLDVDVDENEPPGLLVAQTVARDADSGENGYISYSIANLVPVPFEIDPFTGAVRTTEMLDYETGRRRYVLKIRASDWGTPYRRQTELLLTVSVRDVNDNRPQFERTGCQGQVPRTSPIGSELLTLSAVDFDEGSAVSYRIVSGNEDGCFSLDAHSGSISVACDLADLGISERYINVTATDGQHFADTMAVKINLVGSRKRLENDATTVERKFECRTVGLDKRFMEMSAATKRQNGPSGTNDGTELPPLPSRYGQNIHTPEFFDFPVQVRVNESVSSGTALVRLRARDRDHGYNGLLVYVISSGDDDSSFQVDMETGLLRVVGPLDRERKAGYALNITVYDLGQPQRSTWRLLPVIVTDVNDNPPRFERPVISVSIAETAGMGTSVTQLSAADVDEGDNARITYHLVSDTPDFRLDSNSGLLTVSAPLDRERRDFYELTVMARDGGLISSTSPAVGGLSSKALVRIKILDVNDVAPRFARPFQVVKVREDIPIGTVVALMGASDPDLGLGGQVRYSLSGSFASEQVDRFSIDKLTGTIRVIRKLDFEERQVYNLTIRAKDRGSPSLSSDAHLAVEVIDVNENLYPPRFDDFVTSASVKENAPIGTLVANLTATDTDLPGDDSRLSYFIRGGDGLGLFSIDNEGSIRTRAVLDRESQPHYWLTVVAQDHGIVSLSSSIEVFVEVLDENDHIPLTSEAIYWVNVAENSPSKTAVVCITAEDGDFNLKQKLTFQLKAGNPQSLFDIDPHTGNITTTGRRLDRENLTEHILEVVVSDNGHPALSSHTRVVVTVDDVNDNAPEFLERFYKVQIPSSRPINEDNPLLQVVAFDRDVGPNGEIEYSIMETAKLQGKFRIHPHTGVVYTQKNLVAGQEFAFNVRASDRGQPPRNATTRVAVTIIGVPPNSANPPELSEDNSRRADVMESDPVGHAVAFISARDPDDDMLWYKIEGGNTGDKFAIYPTTGKVYVAQLLNWEEQSHYILNISISDGPNTIYTQLDITVLDVNDHAPEFSQKVYYAETSENADVGSEILQLNATDADQDKRCFYSFHAASSAISMRKFKIDSTRGTIVLAEKLDRETMAQHVLTVAVKDQGTPSKRNFARVIIDVLDHNDHAPEFMSDLIQVRIFETAAISSVVTSLMVIDKDRGANGKVTFSISSGNVGGAFLIEPDSGLIRVNQMLDVHTAHEYMLVVRATDGGSPPLSSTCRVHILVTMGENDPPKFTQEEYTADVFEDAISGTFVVQVTGRSISSLLYEITSGNDGDNFIINPSTGIIVTRGGLDYESKQHYNLSIRAMNMAGASTGCRVLIHVLDVNDNAPKFVQERYEGTVMESASIGSLVFSLESATPLVISATDGDSGVNALLSYDIVEPHAAALFAIDSNTGAVRTLAPLDREQLAVVEFTVQVSDNGKPKIISDDVARIRINIVDVNDSPPKFTNLPSHVSVLLPTYVGIAVIRVTAMDPDVDINSTLLFDISGGNTDNKFAIDRKTGWITIANADGLASYYQLEVSVTDGKFSSAASVVIQLERIQATGLTFTKDKYIGYVAENSTKIVTVVALNVLGTLLNEHVSFSILNPEGMFEVGPTSGIVQTTGLTFDREIKDSYLIVIEARSERDEGEKPRIAHTCVEVKVTDINDNRPFFLNLPYYSVVSVEAQKGEVVTKVHALDSDIGENGEIRYELTRGTGELFRVDRRSGEITLRQNLEGHNTDYELVISAYDGGSPPLSSEAVVRIKVIDRTMPVFMQQYYLATISESADPFSPVLSVQASNPLGRKLIYSIVTGNEAEEFAVDFNTGLIYIVSKLDYEIRSKYELLVRATDSVSGVYAEVPVNIKVEDANDSPPEFTHNEYNITISEATPFATTVLIVNAHDQDSGVNAKVRYRLIVDTDSSSSSLEYFQIDPEDGTIILSRFLDRETQAKHHILVMASDEGNPSLSSTAHVWITVGDINDNPPKFELRSYRCVLSEDAKRGQFVSMMIATDPDIVDESRLTYAITGGNDQQMFAIDSRKGIVTLSNLHRFGEQPNYLLNISASDGVYTSYASLQIDLLSTNRHSPQFLKSTFEAEVIENSPAGTKVIQVEAIDLDRDDFGRITYFIPSDVALESFRIDEGTGDIFTKKTLDREIRKFYDIPLLAIDAGGKTGHSVLRIKVGDVNDNKPKFVLVEYKANIHSNFSVGQSFLKVQAVDPDAEQAGKVLYSIYESNGTRASEIFGINPNSGDLFLTRNAVGLENEMFQFFVRADDNGVPSLGTEAPVDILIMGLQDRPPVFERTSSKYFVSESAPVGTTIARIKAVSLENLHYSVVPESKNGDQDNDQDVSTLFSIDDEGQLFLSQTLDREVSDTHLVTILASTDGSPPLIATTEVVVQVLDFNEHAPEFESNPYRVIVAENADKGTSIMRVIAYDGDRIPGSHGDMRYSFGPSIGDLANVFRLDTITGWITTLAPLDREECDQYILPIVATDNVSLNKLNSTTAVIIDVKDYNDNPPQFTQNHYIAAVNEEALPGTVVIRLSTTDKDRDLERSTQLQYYIVDGDPRSQFGVKSGEIYVERSLDREEIGSYNIRVLATDGFFTAATQVAIDVLDDNDNPPYCIQHRYNELIPESTPPGTFILRVRAFDVDEGANAKMRFYLTGEAAEFFLLDGASGQLKTAKALDRETRPVYFLTAHVQDRERPQWECTSDIIINLLDVNDNPPKFTQELYFVSIPEDAEIRMLVTKVHANDNDVGENRKIRYSLSTSADGHFAIDSETGIVTVAKSLDRETIAVFNLTVVATDMGIPPLSSTANVTISVLDVNDNPPEFTRKFYYASASENAAIGTEVIRVSATSLDIGINAEIRYSILGGNEHRKFSIDNQTGSIFIAEQLDYERAHEFFLTIQAIDGGTPPLSNHATVNITVIDSNDNSPIFGQTAYSAVIREDSVIGEAVLKVYAADLDGGDNGKITYTILQGDRHSQFRIDSDTGLISVADQLDREMISNYILEIEARDNGIPSLASVVRVNLEISDANDNSPMFSQPNYTAIAQEDKPLGFIILRLQVSDADGPANAAPFTFEIRSGNVENAFRIDHDGSLRTAKRFNHKLLDSYHLEIRVYDNGNPPLYSDTWVAVKVIEESKYPPIITPLEVTINSFMDEFAGGTIGRVHVTDQDPYDTLTFSLVAPPKSLHPSPSPSLFDIDPIDGLLIAKPGLDSGTYSVNVSVSDGKFNTFSAVKVNVVLISEEARQNAVILTIREMSGEDFLLSYRKNFLKAVRNIMNVRTKDVFILSIQPQIKNNRTERETQLSKKQLLSTRVPPWRIREPVRSSRPNLDILFAVQKSSVGFFPPFVVRKQLMDNMSELESTIGHHKGIMGIVQSQCTPNFCSNGKCYDRVVLDDVLPITLTTDITSLVVPRHSYIPDCLCKDGYGGDKCDIVTNECAKNPCSDNLICRPEITPPGYSCRCSESSVDCVNELAVSVQCTDKTTNGDCYEPRHPLSFSGKSYAQYNLGSTIDRHLLLSLRVRTVHPTGNLMFAAGHVDYNVLEIVNGQVQYRFDCGSGEGLVRVAGVAISDGLWHEIRLERQGSTAEIIVDKKHRAQGAAPGVNDVLNLESNDVFFGAEVRIMPSVLQAFDDVRMGFVGCLDDIRLNHSLLPHHITNTPTNRLGGVVSPFSGATLKRFTNVEFLCRLPLDRPGICGSQPCLNGGSCTEVGGLSYQCQCRQRFTGPRCEIDTDPCASSPCLYGGKCYNLNNDFRCECPRGLSGKRCEYGRHCNPNPCKHGGICEEGTTGPICKCRGFTGELCNVDINECEPNPCHNGGTCVNIVGSFQCLCTSNATGHYCTESILKNDLIISGKHGITLEEVIGIAVAVTVILLLALLFIICQRARLKRRRNRPSNLIIDHTNGKELIPLNSNRNGELSEFKRNSKMSNLEVSQVPPMLPPRPASYTPSANEPTYIPLNNLDTIRSYGSAADELETYPMLGISTYGHNPDYHTNLNRPVCASNGVGSPAPPLPINEALSDTDSLHKPCWSDVESNLKGSYYEAAKIHNDLKGKPTEPVSSRSNNYGILLNNVKSTNKDAASSIPHSNAVASVTSLSSVDDCAARDRRKPAGSPSYHWDCSDWAHQSQNPLPNITEVPGSEIPDSSSFHSNESNESNNAQHNDLLLNGLTISPERDLDTLVEDQHSMENGMMSADSECGTDSELCSRDSTNPFRTHRQPPSFEQILARSGLRLSDLAIVSLPDSDVAPSESEAPSDSLPPPGNYVRHPNLYLPPYSIASETEPEDDRSLRCGMNHFQDDDMDDTPSSHSSFASQIHRPVMLRNASTAAATAAAAAAAASAEQASMGSCISQGSCSDISNLCEIEDSEYEIDEMKMTKQGPPLQTAV